MAKISPILDLRNRRLDKVKALREIGINPYPSHCSRTHHASTILNDYEKYEGKTVTVAGRLMSWRKHGASTFGHLQDQTGRVQIYVRRDVLKPAAPSNGNLEYSEINLLDVGDFLEATGTVIKTQRGEISVLPNTIRLLTKSLRPLPDKWSGLKDREAILRRRYLHTTIQADQKTVFEAISRMLFAMRVFLDDRGFLEFNTPVLQPQYGGGTAKPFVTHVNALDCDMYLAISHELYLKRLIAAGYDNVYTIGRYFRNEGIDRNHNPEFSMIETMTAYENYEYNMDLVEQLLEHVAKSVLGRTEFIVRGHQIDVGRPWRRISMTDAVLEVTGIDFQECQSIDEANAHLASLAIHEPQSTIGLALAKTFEVAVEPTLIQPTLVFGHPMEISPLAKPMEENPNFAERFEIFIAGMECGDNWSEQNDPVQLLSRWRSEYRPEDKDSGDFHPLDYDFIEALEYGIPPTTGIGVGIERLAMMFTEQDNIDDVIFFPMMKPVLSSVNASIYGIDELPSRIIPDEDVLLTIEEFETLVSNNLPRPQTSKVTICPYLRIWDTPVSNGPWRASGYLEIRGFFKAKRLRLVGYTIKSVNALDNTQECNRFTDLIDLSIPDTIRMCFGDCEVQIAEVVRLDCIANIESS